MLQLENLPQDINIQVGVYIVATPIGNKYDITIRAIKVLEKSDIVICEDSRVTKKLFKLLGISTKKKWFIYNDHITENKKNAILRELKEDKVISLVSDAGTPLISDPGYKLLNEIRKKQHNIYSVPGPCAAIAALTLSGIKTDKFCFLGFLPKDKNNYVHMLRKSFLLNYAIIIFEKSSRIPFLLNVMKEHFNNFKLVIIKEITKLYEKIYFLEINNIDNFLIKNKNLKGEYTIVLEIENRINKVFSDKEIKNELKRLKPSQVSAMLSKKSSQSRDIIYKRCLSIINEKKFKK